MAMDLFKRNREVKAGTHDEVSAKARDAPPGEREGWIQRDDRDGTEVSCSMLFSGSVVLVGEHHVATRQGGGRGRSNG